MFMMTVLMVFLYDIELVHAKGHRMNGMLPIEFNNSMNAPPKDRVRLKLSARR
jgi:hypothetical protein